jgi:hypothetical protein
MLPLPLTARQQSMQLHAHSLAAHNYAPQAELTPLRPCLVYMGGGDACTPVQVSCAAKQHTVTSEDTLSKL